MGKFTNKIKMLFRGESREFKELKKKHGLDADAELYTVKPGQMNHNAYFIREAANPKIYVHFENGEYIARDSPVMACVFTWRAAENFIKSAPTYNLEMIRVDEALKGYSEKELHNPLLDKIKNDIRE